MVRQEIRVSGNSPKIEFVYFDLGNVLLSFDPQLACNNLANLCGISPEQAQSFLYDSGIEDQFEHGELSPESFVNAFRRQLPPDGDDVADQAMLDAMSDMFQPITSMEGVLQAVRDQGIGVGLLSNTCHAHLDWVRRQKYAVTDFEFDATILSYEVGAMKPAAAIYQAAEDAVEPPANQILFLDDKPENTEAARQRGWQAVNCFGGSDAIDALRTYQVMGELS